MVLAGSLFKKREFLIRSFDLKCFERVHHFFKANVVALKLVAYELTAESLDYTALLVKQTSYMHTRSAELRTYVIAIIHWHTDKHAGSRD